MSTNVNALAKREGETDIECIERFLTTLIVDRPEVKRAYPIRRSVPHRINRRGAALWLAVEDANGCLTAELIQCEYWNYASRGVMLEHTMVPEWQRPFDQPPRELIDYLDAGNMPRHWPVSTALQVRVWRDAMNRTAQYA